MQRNFSIDFLRGISILSVLLLHFNIAYQLDHSWLSDVFSTDIVNALARNGNYGVTLFFVISGFLITKTSLQRYQSPARINLRAFYVFRFARIMPCLVLALTMIFILSQCHIAIYQNTPNTTSLSLALLSVLTFWHNVLMAQFGYFNYCLNILWSLSVEEVFYFAFPMICLILKRPLFISLFLLCFIVFAPYYRSLHQHNEIIALYGYFSCFDAIALGCITALLSQQITRMPSYLRLVLKIGAWVLLITTYLSVPIMKNIILGVSLVALSGAILLLIASLPTSSSKTTPRSLYRLIAWFGSNSYEFYLFHIIVLAAMRTILPPEQIGHHQKLAWFVLFITLSSFVVALISKCYSKPLNRYFRQVLLSKQDGLSAMKISESAKSN